ncbi:response regulator [Xenophilus arseniciresistens]|uniref:Virulence sensor protein BvgS n=1 Tax=Xenophilus arseniciresistens TaxID=1283306 RepID=A0AAE3N8K1_9BURK|nr:response regulator [Xenophilus arseniciresistens]MDA7416593.1 response regulator [Xenophilus arseniciresistens]
MPQAPSATAIAPQDFRRLLARNVKLPLLLGLAGALVFVGLIFYLLSVISWVEHTDRVTRDSIEAQREQAEMQSAVRGFLLTGDDSFLQPFDASERRAQALLAELPARVADNPPQVSRATALIELQKRWSEYARDVIERRRAGEALETVLQTGRGKQLADEIRTVSGTFLQAEQALRETRNAQANRTALIVVIGYLVVCLSISAVLALWGRRQLLGLSQAYDQTLSEHLAQSDLLREQAWLRGAQTELASQTVGQLSAHDLGERVLRFFATHAGSVIGAAYVSEAQGTLRRVATYGYSREAEALPHFVQPGEGLVGQAAAQGRLLQLSPVPEGYVRVNSGLGEASPHTLLLLPIAHEGEVNGVIELGLLAEPGPQVLALLHSVAEDAGSSMAAARYRERLQNVLAQTQQLNEELQVQQEELRTANEELEEQSRALKESQVHLENQQAELEQTNSQLAERTEQLDQRNLLLRRAQQDLEQRADDLQRASRYKSEFLANMSHELRTPLNSSLILSKLLADNPQGNLSQEQVKFAQSIYSSGNDLLVLINDVLDIAKVEAGRLDVHAEHVPVPRLLESLRATFAPLAQQKSLALSIEVAPDAPAQLVSDRQRLEQILKNLMSNAIKFTDHGRVALSVAREGDGLRFDVSDSGIGIAPDQQQLIFEAFHQADGTTSRKYGGTGLGLSISRDLAALLGGTLQVRSTPGQGSTFTLTLPHDLAQPLPEALRAQPPGLRASAALAPPAQHAPAVAAPVASAPAAAAPQPTFDDDRDQPAGERRRVLVIEDEPQFARILYDLAHEYGWHCTVAHGAHEGFALARQLQPQAILLDMRLPDSPGLSVLQQLKDDAHTRHIPVHVVSAQDQAEAALHLGAVGYALKPTTREQLQAVFTRLDAKLSQTVKQVLLVEDDDLQRDSVVQLIADEDVRITAVATGEEALALLRERVFDCMITDLRLPDMQGGELLQRMSGEEICSFPPVIVYTGRNLTREEEAELMRYSRSIIIKGARSPERLLDEVTLFLHKVEAQLSSERQSMLRSARGRDRVFEGRRILLVDDDVRNIFALTSALEQRGAMIEVARNGREALDKLDAVPDIDLVLMDVMMPEMDGLEATRRLRQDRRFTKLPVITVTAKAMKDDQEQCLAAGASDYLAKPIDLDRLFSLLRVWMPHMERL